MLKPLINLYVRGEAVKLIYYDTPLLISAFQVTCLFNNNIWCAIT